MPPHGKTPRPQFFSRLPGWFLLFVWASLSLACGNLGQDISQPLANLILSETSGPTITPTPTFFSPYTNTPIPTATPTITGTLPPTFTPVPTLTPITPLSLGTPFPTGGKEIVNVLLLGADYSGTGIISRTDTIIIASIRPGDRMVSLISIPRDLYVDIPGRGMNRINTAFVYGELDHYPGGGKALLLDTIHNNLGITIDHIAMVNFDGFRQIVDTLGGVDVPLACPFADYRLNAATQSLYWYSVGPGVVHMDGYTALWYARSRMSSNDFDRGRRQQEILRAIYNKALQLDIVPQIPSLYQNFQQVVLTDMELGDILSMVPLSLDVSSPRIRSYSVSGPTMVTSWITPGGAYVLLPNYDGIYYMLQEALGPPAGEEVEHLRTVVQIRNESATANMDTLAAERMNYAGYQSLIIPSTGQYEPTTLLYDLTLDQDPVKSQELLALFGLSAANLRSEPTGGDVAYRLVLGGDFYPCFAPFQIDR
ncbi:MAG: LCP family protein [Anaerolineales bacterium]|nr:LCP family protein [Anaerolineales bacterium]